jgi:ribokinase
VAAVQLAKLAGRATFLTALATDDAGAALRTELEDRGVTLHAGARPGRHRRGLTHIDAGTGERTITILGERIVPRGDDPLPWGDLHSFDALYFTAGDAFAAGLTFGLGAGLDLRAALHLGARCGAHCLGGRGPYAGQLELVRR